MDPDGPPRPALAVVGPEIRSLRGGALSLVGREGFKYCRVVKSSTAPAAWPNPSSAVLRWLMLYGVSATLLLLLRRSALDEPHLWDALGCYVAQARFIAEHGVDFSQYHQLSFVRPPVFLVALAVTIRVFGESLWLLHGVTLLFAASILPSVYLLTRRLGGDRWAALFAAAFCLASPPFFAQAGIVESDLPVSAFSTLAWLLFLHEQRWAFCAVATLGVLTKESGYFICAPAALWLLTDRRQGLRAVLGRSAAASAGQRLQVALGWAWQQLLPTVIPVVVLACWQGAQRFLVGAILPAIYDGYVGPGNLSASLPNTFVLGGRAFLWPLALAALARSLRVRRVDAPSPAFPPAETERARRVLFTALAVALLPFLFPTPLQRYQLPSLPLLCALAGVGLGSWARLATRLALGCLVLALLLAGLNGRWHGQDNAALEVSLAYRELLRNYQRATAFLEAAQPRRIIAGFPMSSMLTAPAAGFVTRPLPILGPAPGQSTSELCDADFLVDAQDDSVGPALRRLAACGALDLQLQLGPPPRNRTPLQPLDPEWDRTVRLYRVHCPPTGCAAPPSRAPE